MRARTWAVIFAGSLVAALTCGDDESTPGAAGAAGGIPGLVCPASGVLRGPWSLRFDETSTVVRWDACAPSAADVVVEPEAGGAAITVTGTQTAYEVQTSYALIDGVPPDLPGTYYTTEVAIDGLAPGTCYRYHIAVDSARSGRFCTARAASDTFTFLALGDTNPAIGDTAGVLEHTLPGVDFVLHLGDIQYYESVFDSWTNWFNEMTPLLQQGAFMPCIGNHETEHEHEFADYYTRLFGGAGFDGTVEWYRFQSGGVWFFSMDTEEDFDAGTPQAEWLEAQLADAAAQPGYRGAVVYFHRPMYTLSEYGQQTSERIHFDPIFRQHGVKLVLAGHVHGYERFVDGELTHVVTGGGGALLHDLDASAADRPMEAALRVASAHAYHGTVIEVSPTGLRGRAISATGEELDAFTIPLD